MRERWGRDSWVIFFGVALIGGALLWAMFMFGLETGRARRLANPTECEWPAERVNLLNSKETVCAVIMVPK